MVDLNDKFPCSSSDPSDFYTGMMFWEWSICTGQGLHKIFGVIADDKLIVLQSFLLIEMYFNNAL